MQMKLRHFCRNCVLFPEELNRVLSSPPPHSWTRNRVLFADWKCCSHSISVRITAMWLVRTNEKSQTLSQTIDSVNCTLAGSDHARFTSPPSDCSKLTRQKPRIIRMEKLFTWMKRKLYFSYLYFTYFVFSSTSGQVCSRLSRPDIYRSFPYVIRSQCCKQ